MLSTPNLAEGTVGVLAVMPASVSFSHGWALQQPWVQVTRLQGGWQHPTAGLSPGGWVLTSPGAWCCQAEADTDPWCPASPEPRLVSLPALLQAVLG